MLNSSRHRVLADALAEVERLREDEQQHAEQQQRTGQRPQVAERGAEVAAAELGDRDQVQQVEDAAPAAARAPTGRGPRAARATRRSWLERRLHVGVDGHAALPALPGRRRRSRTAAAGAARCRPARGCARRSSARSSGRASAGSRSRRDSRTRLPSATAVGLPVGERQRPVEAEHRLPLLVEDVDREHRRLEVAPRLEQDLHADRVALLDRGRRARLRRLRATRRRAAR